MKKENPPHMIITELQINDAAKRQLHLIASRQIPFAVATSLTAVAKIAQAEVRDHINETDLQLYSKSAGCGSHREATWQSLPIRI